MIDWDDAFANMAYVPDAEALPGLWAREAAAFRAALGGRLHEELPYGAGPRRRLDLALPEREPKGLVALLHGGYWLRFSKADWTHLAEGALAHGWAVALPSYRLAPEARIAEIVAEAGAAIEKAASLVAGPIRLVGHSAGGHLATRMLCADSPLPEALFARIEKTLSISGLHDLRPLLRTKMNAALRLSAEEAAAESPALRQPKGAPRLTCWVGGRERPEFLRQARLMALVWEGLDAKIDLVEEAGRDHFSVLEGLRDSGSALTAALLGP